ncbi:MAG: RsmD family RNA methyltransferase [Candidatus Coatesbacteria bacterium]|mgnify:CR=1 FL=1
MKPGPGEPRKPLRIGSGALRGRRLVAPGASRPPLALLRKSLFDILAPRLPGARVLDVYAGSGSLGLESVSRGAARVDFVEESGEACRILAENVARTGLAGSARVICREALVGLRELDRAEARYDLVLLDPPFADERDGELLSAAARLVEPGGAVVLRIPARRNLPPVRDALRLIRHNRYGASLVGVYAREEES